jgi:hypothetical protein
VCNTWQALQALAAAVNNGSVVLSGGLIDYPAANMNATGLVVPTFPGMPEPVGVFATGAFPATPAANRFSYQGVPVPGGVRVVQYSVTDTDCGKPVARPAVPSSPVCVITWAPAPVVPAPADGQGLVGDDWARVQAQGAAVDRRGRHARAQQLLLIAGTGGNITLDGKFSVTFPDLRVDAAVAISPGNGFLYYNVTGLGSSTIGLQAYYINWFNGALNPAGNVNAKAAVFAVGTPIEPTREDML